jgi:hypothetical protein
MSNRTEKQVASIPIHALRLITNPEIQIYTRYRDDADLEQNMQKPTWLTCPDLQFFNSIVHSTDALFHSASRY